VWRVVGLVVVGSILLHGLSASPAMHLVDRKQAQMANSTDAV
jgi:hypothetical protein